MTAGILGRDNQKGQKRFPGVGRRASGLDTVLQMRGTPGISRGGKWPIHLSVDAGRTWSYHSEDALTRTNVSVTVPAAFRKK